MLVRVVVVVAAGNLRRKGLSWGLQVGCWGGGAGMKQVAVVVAAVVVVVVVEVVVVVVAAAVGWGRKLSL